MARQSVAAGLLGYIQSPIRDINALLFNVARDLIAGGLDVRGAVQVNSHAGRARRCDVDLELLPSGQRLRVSQSLGSGARGCRLDSGGLETAVAAVKSGFSARADLLVINKFGKAAAGGSGFRALIAEAVSLGIPVLTSVNTMNLNKFSTFSTGYCVPLEPEHDAVKDWFLNARSTSLGN